MVKADFDISEGKSLILRIDGHAGQNDVGKDIICSAASILSFTLVQVVNEMFKDKKLRKKPTVVLKEGHAEIIAKPKKEYFEETLHLFCVAETGYRLLAHNYPEFVQISPFNRG